VNGDGTVAGRVALVTGAAGGIGSAVAELLCERGVLVAAVDRDKAHLEELVQRQSGCRGVVRAYSVDVTDSASVSSVVDLIEEELGPIRYLVNGAGVLRLGSVCDFSDEDWEDVFSVNVTGVFNMSRAVISRMVGRHDGAVVTVASNAAGTPRAEMAAYAASKAAASMFTKSLGLEVAVHGVRCNLVAPGSTATPMLTSMWRDATGKEATIGGRPDVFRNGIPLGKLATPRDVASAVAFLLSDEASHITMHELTVDGGATLGA